MKTTTHYTALIALTVALSQIVACGQGNSKKLKLKAKKARQSITNFKNGADTQNKALTKIKSTDELKVLTTNLEDGKSEMHRLMINKGKAKDSVTSIDMNITCVKDIEAATKMSLSHPGLFVLQGSTVRLVRNLNRKMTAKDLSKKNSSQTAKITNLEPLLEVTCGTNKDNKKEIFVAKNKDEAKVLNEIFKTVDLAKKEKASEQAQLIQSDSKARHLAQFTCSGDLANTKTLVLEDQAYGILIADGSEVITTTQTEEVLTAESKAKKDQKGDDKTNPELTATRGLSLSYIHCNSDSQHLPVKSQEEINTDMTETGVTVKKDSTILDDGTPVDSNLQDDASKKETTLLGQGNKLDKEATAKTDQEITVDNEAE